jgi:hypothetical protein
MFRHVQTCSDIYITLFKYRVYPHIRNQSIVKFQYTLVFLFQYVPVSKRGVYYLIFPGFIKYDFGRIFVVFSLNFVILTSRRCFWAQCNSGGLTKVTNAAAFGFHSSGLTKTTNAAPFGFHSSRLLAASDIQRRHNIGGRLCDPLDVILAGSGLFLDVLLAGLLLAAALWT